MNCVSFSHCLHKDFKFQLGDIFFSVDVQFIQVLLHSMKVFRDNRPYNDSEEVA